jgi:hypothetical protein
MVNSGVDGGDPATWLGVIRRYWYVFTAIVVVTLLGALVVPLAVQPAYQAERAVLLIRGPLPAELSDSGEPIRPDNPFLASGGGLTTVAQAVQVAISGREVREAARAAGLDSTYEVTSVRGQPILTITVDGSDPTDVLATLERVVQEVDGRLEAIQVDSGVVEPDQLIRTQLLGEAPTAAAEYKERTRVRVIIVSIGGGTFLLTLYFLATRRPVRSGRRGRTEGRSVRRRRLPQGAGT